MLGAGAGLFLSGLAAMGAALLSIALVIVVLGFAESGPAPDRAGDLRDSGHHCGILLVLGVTKNAIDSTIVLNLLGGAGGLFIGIAAIVNVNALGVSVFSR